MKPIPFSPPDVTQAEIDAVVEVLRSGWITSGPRTQSFEAGLSDLGGTRRTVALSSATAALELTLRTLRIGRGDEVITTAYTYTASASVIDHVGADIVLVDTLPGTFDMDPEAVAAAITSKTKAIIAVDLAGVMYDHRRLVAVADASAKQFSPASDLQEALGRVAVIADGAHSVGAVNVDGPSGSAADFTCYSFHAVKNLTTAEGGAVTWRGDLPVDHDELYQRIRRSSLHGQTKDALAKSAAGSWEYDIVETGYKANMTDIQAALGLVQLERYPAMIDHRHAVADVYNGFLDGLAEPRALRGDGWRSSAHLYMVRLPFGDPALRNRMIAELAEDGISTNVHYKPLPLLTAYRNLGFDIADFPNARQAFESEVTLPLYSTLSLEDAERVGTAVADWIRKQARA